MYKLILPFITVLCLSSCYTTDLTYLTAKYKPNPISITKVPGLSKDQAWDRAVRLFAERNISIKTIDKSSGFIQSNIVSFISAYQIDGINAPPYPPYIITERSMSGGELSLPSYLTGSLKIFLLNDSAQTEIRVSIEDLRIDLKPSQYYSSYTNAGELRYRALSTGKLESEIADHISTGINPPNTIRIQNGVIRNPYYNYSIR
jgi:hypothetical protein